MKKVILILGVFLFVVSGCQVGTTVTGSASLFYPEIETKDGGKFGDPGGRGHGMNFGSGSQGTKSVGNFGRDK